MKLEQGAVVADHAAVDEFESVIAVDARAFGWRAPEALRQRWRELYDPERVVVTRDGGLVVGSAISTSTLMTVAGGPRLPAAAVIGVGVAPSHRRQGRLRAMMRCQLDEIRERKEPLAVLQASEGGIYGQYGYGAATFAHRYRLDRGAAELFPGDGCGGRVTMVDSEQALEALQALMREAVLLRPGEIDPLGAEWVDIEGVENPEEAQQRFFALFEESGRIDGALAYRLVRHPPSGSPSPGPRRSALVERFVSLTEPAYLALWRFLLGIDLVSEVLTEDRPVDEPIRWRLSDPRQLWSVSLADQAWLRLVDVGAALSARRYGSPGVVRIEVSDPFCPWNDGLYRLDAHEPGAGESRLSVGTFGASVERIAASESDGEADVSLDVAALASIYLGGASPTALAAVGRVKAASREMLLRFEQIFAVSTAPFCTAGL